MELKEEPAVCLRSFDYFGLCVCDEEQPANFFEPEKTEHSFDSINREGITFMHFSPQRNFSAFAALLSSQQRNSALGLNTSVQLVSGSVNRLE